VKRFAKHGPVGDLCCGIGGDLLAFAQLGASVGVDRNPIMAILAAANARAVLPEQVAARTAIEVIDVEQFELADCAAWHIDPDRRPTGSRTSRLAWSSPSADVVERLLAAVPHAAIKLAPAAEVPEPWADHCELEWISRDRECRQLVAWHGALAEDSGQRRATVLDKDGSPIRSVLGQPDVHAPIAERLGRYLYEPDSAVLAAHLVGTLAAQHGISRVSAGIAYLTGDVAINDPALSCFEICEILSFDIRKLAAHLCDHQIGTLEIKKRGVDVDPDRLRRQLKLRGDRSATLIVTPHGGKQVALVARRLDFVSSNTLSSSDPRPLSSELSHASCL
jgi:hypothetical protein